MSAESKLAEFLKHLQQVVEWEWQQYLKDQDYPTSGAWGPESNAKAIVALERERAELAEALQPFVRFSSSNETIDVKLRTADIARARTLLAKHRKETHGQG